MIEEVDRDAEALPCGTSTVLPVGDLSNRICGVVASRPLEILREGWQCVD
jgi:hypothetical protein